MRLVLGPSDIISVIFCIFLISCFFFFFAMVISNNNNKVFCATKKNRSFFELLYFRGVKMSLGWEERENSLDGENSRITFQRKFFSSCS